MGTKKINGSLQFVNATDKLLDSAGNEIGAGGGGGAKLYKHECEVVNGTQYTYFSFISDSSTQATIELVGGNYSVKFEHMVINDMQRHDDSYNNFFLAASPLSANVKNAYVVMRVGYSSGNYVLDSRSLGSTASITDTVTEL